MTRMLIVEMMNFHVLYELKVKETVSGEARGVRWGVHSIYSVRKRATCDFQGAGPGWWTSKSDLR